MPTRRTCGPCFREIEKGGDRRVAEGLTPSGFWELEPDHRRSMWKVWVRTIVDQLLAPTAATLFAVETRELKEWHVTGVAAPPERLVGPVIETVVYLSALDRQRQPDGDCTRPGDVKSVKVDLEAVGRFFGIEMKVVDRHFAPPVER